MRLLAVISGEYGKRHVDNLRAHGPTDWVIHTWKAPAALPMVIDEPREWLPETMPAADVIFAFGEQPGVAELIPEIARMSGAKAVIAPVDREEWLPSGLARQLRGWLEEMDVVCATPKPLCSLAVGEYNLRSNRMTYNDPLIAEVANYFGRPKLRIGVDPETRTIRSVDVQRDAFCGCARHVVSQLIGVSADDAEERAGLLHHHYPCLAGMHKDVDLGDTLMHVSGNILKNEVSQQVKPYVKVSYFVPGGRADGAKETEDER